MSSVRSTAVSPLQQDDEPLWESFVTDHPLATPFHTLAWKRSVERAFGYDERYKTVRNDDDIVAVVPGFDCGGPVRSTVVNPFCEYGFPLLASRTDLEDVLVGLRERRLQTVLLKDADWTGTVGYNSQCFGGVETGHVRRLSLPGSFDALTEYVFDRKLRQNVSKALDSGVSVRETTDVETFYPLYLTTMRRRGSPQFPRVFFEALLAEFGESCSLLLAESDGNPIGGLLALDHGETRYLFSNGSSQDHLEKRPNDLLYWRSIEQACQRGYDTVDFGRSEAGSGVDRFKARFGGDTMPLTTLVTPPHRVDAGSVSGYRRLEPIAKRLAPVVTHPSIGPRLKEWIHE